jgi:hypothetical protein
LEKNYSERIKAYSALSDSIKYFRNYDNKANTIEHYKKFLKLRKDADLFNPVTFQHISGRSVNDEGRARESAFVTAL